MCADQPQTDLQAQLAETIAIARGKRPRTQAATPQFALGEHVLVLVDFLVYRATITQILPNYTPGVNAYVVFLHDAPAYLPSPEMIVVEGAVGNDAIVGRPSAMLDWDTAITPTR